jgi:AsmA-like C-terminal region
MTSTTIAALLKRSWKPLAITTSVGALLLVVGVVILCRHWPASRQAVLQDLQDASMSKVQFGAFHSSYFPSPGCTIEQVTFQHNLKPGTAPLITAQRITIKSSFLGLFAKHVKSIRVEGMHILAPPRGTGEQFQVPGRSSIVIDDLVADGAILEIASGNPGKPPLRFAFHEFTLGDVDGSGPASFKAKFSNPEPPGEISTEGNFGPWNDKDVGGTPVSGKYLFQQADIGAFAGIVGTLSSSGQFAGTLEHISTEGTTDTPNFAIRSSSHQTRLRADFQAEVNGTNGDTSLRNVAAHFGQTTVRSEGSVAGSVGQEGKTTLLNIATKAGRIEDILDIFVRSDRPPMAGIVDFMAEVRIAPGRRSFFQKLELQGDFGIDDGKFSKLATQERVNSLSEGARGESDHARRKKERGDPLTVLSDLKGHVVLKNGTANLSALSFSIPGAVAHLQGTYNLISEKIDLHGTLSTNSELSKTTHGMKAMILKALDPFFKKHHADYVAPVKITGTYQHPSFGLDLMDRDDKPHAAKKE